MKIVDHKTFMTLPAGIIYAEYEPCVMGDMCIKGDTIRDGLENIDWVYDCIEDPWLDADGDRADTLLDLQGTGGSVLLDLYSSSRDGAFDDDQLYAVFERGDVQALIARLQAAEASAFGAKK